MGRLGLADKKFPQPLPYRVFPREVPIPDDQDGKGKAGHIDPRLGGVVIELLGCPGPEHVETAVKNFGPSGYIGGNLVKELDKLSFVMAKFTGVIVGVVHLEADITVLLRCGGKQGKQQQEQGQKSQAGFKARGFRNSSAFFHLFHPFKPELPGAGVFPQTAGTTLFQCLDGKLRLFPEQKIEFRHKPGGYGAPVDKTRFRIMEKLYALPDNQFFRKTKILQGTVEDRRPLPVEDPDMGKGCF
jgi:hypothetical protein